MHIKLGFVMYVSSLESLGMTPCLKGDLQVQALALGMFPMCQGMRSFYSILTGA